VEGVAGSGEGLRCVTVGPPPAADLSAGCGCGVGRVAPEELGAVPQRRLALLPQPGGRM
jgi:hypothetical protein